MQIVINDLLQLEAYVEGLAERISVLNDYCYLGEGEEFNDAIQSYFNNKYKPGITLFLGIFDSADRDNAANHSIAPVICQICVLTKADPKKSKGTLTARNDTWKAALKVLGTMEEDMEETNRANLKNRLRIETDAKRLIPLEKEANADAWGWGFEVTFNIPVNALKY